MSLDENPLVSVIIPMYNAQEWIVGLLESILLQTYKNIEIILVNDGSTDASAEVIDMFSRENSGIKLKVIPQKNSGVSEARNEGVRNSEGELLAFVDSDDIWMPEKIERQVHEMIDRDAAAIACSYAMFRDSDHKILDVVHPKWSVRGVRNWLLFRSYGGLLSSTLMLKREVFERTGPFRKELSLSADIEFAWRLLGVTPIALIDDPLVGYRLRPNQMHKLPELLLTESQRMVEIVELLKIDRFRRAYLANLNLRLFLYRLQEGEFRRSWTFLFEALKYNSWETFGTTLRIITQRGRRKLRLSEKKSILLAQP